jgi:hypothetical protein
VAEPPQDHSPKRRKHFIAVTLEGLLMVTQTQKLNAAAKMCKFQRFNGTLVGDGISARRSNRLNDSTIESSLESRQERGVADHLNSLQPRL